MLCTRIDYLNVNRPFEALDVKNIHCLYTIFTINRSLFLQFLARLCNRECVERMKEMKSHWMKSVMTSLSLCCLAGCSLFLPKETSTLGEVTVVSREEGSGTRGAFTELTHLLETKKDFRKDHTTKEAVIQNNTEGVITTVRGLPSAIGYISFGSINDEVRTVAIDGVFPTVETIQSGLYPIQRPFVVAWKQDTNPLLQNFLQFVQSKEGQEIIQATGFIGVGTNETYQSDPMRGKLSIVGSTSVTPVMEKLTEAYRTLHPEVVIDITSNGSSAGMTSANEGSADLGMSSRELKEKEKEQLHYQVIALDGIALIVHPKNSFDHLTSQQIYQLFSGEIVNWEELEKP